MYCSAMPSLNPAFDRERSPSSSTEQTQHVQLFIGHDLMLMLLLVIVLATVSVVQFYGQAPTVMPWTVSYSNVPICIPLMAEYSSCWDRAFHSVHHQPTSPHYVTTQFSGDGVDHHRPSPEACFQIMPFAHN